ncbi:hypothetical protein RclHR1_02540013 [Rhizophagus clarus]|uniref:Uncharacterized protein n=1 Tax=Rhizophagus clarus TaxID=94130 RepID=A0A2Z6RCW3_9GLOM|nr:hypothetical protein RclHR1_02540013 [Rhizophagus clarus]GES82024.1 hypothetical protein GLOIN_2v1867876 [Rhizophagus clarus]
MLNKLPPEILQIIFKELIEYGNKTLEIHQYFYHDLYNCLFVDRYMFSNAIIFLWQNTLRKFYKKNFTTSKMLMTTYILSLSKESKEILYENKIINKQQKTTNTLCNYGSLLKNFNLTELYTKLVYWMLIITEEFDIEILENMEPNMIIAYHCNDKISEKNRNLLYKEIFNNFIKNSTNLKYQLKLKSNWENINYSHLENLSPLINMGNLECHTNITDKVYKDLSKIITSVDNMRIKCIHDDESKIEGLINFISGLKKIKIMKVEYYESYNPEIITKSFNITNNYQIIIPSDIFIPLKFSSKELEKIKGLIIIDSGIDSIEIVKSWSKFEFLPFITKLKFLSSTMIEINLELYSKIIKKTNENLIELSISLDDGIFHNEKSLFKSITKNCSKLKNFELKIKRKTLQYIPIILQSCKKLEMINLDIMDDKDITKLLSYIGEVLPKNLKYFFIYQNEINWNKKSFNDFLKNCENNSIKNLLIKYKYEKNFENRNEYKKIIWKFVNRGVLNRYSNIKRKITK